jgi:hypothetical protein
LRNGTKIIRQLRGPPSGKERGRERARNTSAARMRGWGASASRGSQPGHAAGTPENFQGYQARPRTGAAGDGGLLPSSGSRAGLLPSSGSRAARNAYPAWPSSGRDGERAHTPWPSSGRGGAHEYPAWPSSGRDGGREHTPRLSSSRGGAYGTSRDAGWTLPPSPGSGGQRGARETLRDAG